MTAVVGIAVATKFVSVRLIAHYKACARRASLTSSHSVIRKLQVAGNIIAICFAFYAVATLLAIFDADAYEKYDYLLEAGIKLSDLLSIGVVFYLYARHDHSTGRGGKAEAIRRISSERKVRIRPRIAVAEPQEEQQQEEKPSKEKKEQKHKAQRGSLYEHLEGAGVDIEQRESWIENW